MNLKTTKLWLLGFYAGGLASNILSIQYVSVQNYAGIFQLPFKKCKKIFKHRQINQISTEKIVEKKNLYKKKII